MSALGLAAVAVAMAVGLAGTLLPFLPGLVLIWAAGLVYGLSAGFGTAGVVAFVVMSVLLVVGTAAQFVLPSWRGAARGAPASVLLAGAGLGVVGFFVVPVIGLPLGAVLGVLLAEYNRTQDWPRAWALTKQVVVGYGIGVLVEFGSGVLMILAWVAWLIAR